jgi:hypothetical protein
MDDLDPSLAEAAEFAQKFLARIEAAAGALKGKSFEDIERAKKESGLPPSAIHAIVALERRKNHSRRMFSGSHRSPFEVASASTARARRSELKTALRRFLNDSLFCGAI